MFALGPALRARTRTAPSTTSAFARPAYSTTRASDPKPDRDKRRKPSLINNAPGWREDLATVSEASVKADHDATTLDEMQQKTVDHIHPHNSDLAQRTHAAYARDEVSGPLGNAGVGVGEFEGVVGNEDLGPDDAHVEPDGRVVTRRVHQNKDRA